ncbi:uncharacterized protein LOC113315104 [Papaver somniferum]|uniref:uncharacterized protein LOC113315104 n=1 Tax=Papaver somniferum TaxID=3469 RepID=UPI000E7017FC|nr:uncharacterized protein LOC113315104 [Papaver somniferum]XP_026419206.1 uncharacterized protein LOC113315104 [Papaver somniferum]XP_026419207.1 uncharacterized protein LOC113315104 [Papaver somniferum]
MVVNLYQLACGLPMHVDSFTCSLLDAWGISAHQMHQSLCFALKRVLSISIAYYRLINSNRDLNANEISAPTPAVPLNQRPGVTAIESDSESYDCHSPKAPEMNSMETDHCQGSSSPFSLIRIRRRHSQLAIIPRMPMTLELVPVEKGSRGFEKVISPLPLHLMVDVRKFLFREASLCGSKGGFSPVLDGNRESTTSGSSDEVLGMNTENSDDISSGCPSPFIDLGDAEVPSGREAVRGNDFSNTLFASSKDTRQLPMTMFYHQVAEILLKIMEKKLSNHPCHLNLCLPSKYFLTLE